MHRNIHNRKFKVGTFVAFKPDYLSCSKYRWDHYTKLRSMEWLNKCDRIYKIVGYLNEKEYVVGKLADETYRDIAYINDLTLV